MEARLLSRPQELAHSRQRPRLGSLHQLQKRSLPADQQLLRTPLHLLLGRFLHPLQGCR